MKGYGHGPYWGEKAQLKCVICGHKEQQVLTSEMPHCPKCYGPVVVERVTVRQRKP